MKLDLERRYCKYYAPLLEVFKRTDVTLNFNTDGNPLDLDLDLISLEDKYTYTDVNENEIDQFQRRFPKYSIDNLISKINNSENERDKESV